MTTFQNIRTKEQGMKLQSQEGKLAETSYMQN